MKLGPVRDMNSLLKKASGLMLRFPKKPYIFRFAFTYAKRISVTMWFVFFPIDVIWVRDGTIVEQVERLLPFQTYFPKERAHEVYEFPARSIQHYQLEVGDHVDYDGTYLYKR